MEPSPPPRQPHEAERGEGGGGGLGDEVEDAPELDGRQNEIVFGSGRNAARMSDEPLEILVMGLSAEVKQDWQARRDHPPRAARAGARAARNFRHARSYQVTRSTLERGSPRRFLQDLCWTGPRGARLARGLPLAFGLLQRPLEFLHAAVEGGLLFGWRDALGREVHQDFPNGL